MASESNVAPGVVSRYSTPVARWLLILALVNGLAPGAGELVETVIHRATTGHFAHVTANDPDLPDGGEHGCGPMAHLCHCCPSQPLAHAFDKALTSQAGNPPRQFWGSQGSALDGFDRLPFQPPIS